MPEMLLKEETCAPWLTLQDIETAKDILEGLGPLTDQDKQVLRAAVHGILNPPTLPPIVKDEPYLWTPWERAKSLGHSNMTPLQAKALTDLAARLFFEKHGRIPQTKPGALEGCRVVAFPERDFDVIDAAIERVSKN